jgi:bifunctional non-homologous end joining protein LigD
MLAVSGDAPLQDERLGYEPKYDGIRALAEVELPPGQVRLWSRLGNDKAGQFPEVVHALRQLARRLKAPVLLDGELVALDDAGAPSGFQRLQKRIHLTGPDVVRQSSRQPVAFIAFDVLRDGTEDLRPFPLVARRARLERIFGNAGSTLLRIADFAAADGRALYRVAKERGWEGIVAKRLDSRYQSGRRSPDWRKLKLQNRQECVIGGFTEPRGSRARFGALILGVYDGHALQYIGHTGTGFDDAELDRLAAKLISLETPTCPFARRPRTNERPHWVRPELVAEVQFSEWTADGVLRHPAYLGLRDDVRPETVRRDPIRPLEPLVRPAGPLAIRVEGVASVVSGSSGGQGGTAAAGSGAETAGKQTGARHPALPRALAGVLAQLESIEDAGGSGILRLPGNRRLEVSNLAKVFWNSPRITKGELMRYYVRVSPVLLPVVADRPLIMKRFPNGIAGKAFYQQRAPAKVSDGVRVAVLPRDTVVPSRLVGGALATLLYMTQLAVISQDPWFSRVQTPDFADHVAFDLDPMPGVAFRQVVDVARFIHDELERLGIPSLPKTSGAEGLHIYIPLPPRTSYQAGRLFCEIIATIVAQRHPRLATVERSVHARGRTVYIDYLQNIRGKSLAAAYSARASGFAGVSTPLTWSEVAPGIDREAFTMRTLPDRLGAVGDLWKPLRASKGADLSAILAGR